MSSLEMIKDGHLGGYIRGGDPGTWCPHLWTWLVQEFAVRSVLDVGCGEGHSTRFFRELGCAARGVDGCARAIADSVIPDRVSRHDFCSGPFRCPQPVELIWSCEFLEHVERAYVPNILQTFAQAARFILVTHAFPGQIDGHHHVNCQPSSYWIERLEGLGFECRAELTRKARRVTLADYHGTNHFARSGLVFVRVRDLADSEETPDILTRLKTLWQAKVKSWRINVGFRWSAAYRRHRRKRRARKRQALTR